MSENERKGITQVVPPATRLVILILLCAGVSYPQKPCPTPLEINGKKITLTEVTIEKTKVKCEVEKIEIKSRGYTAIARIRPKTEVKGKAGDKEKKWVGSYASFIIQKLDVGGTTIILLDTSYYLNPAWYRVGLNQS